jgi:tungstate transport system substrate-binding protein
MGATLNIAAGMNAYTLTDRGTWLSFRNRRSLSVQVEGDPLMFNQYGIMLVNPARHPHVKVAEGRALIEWITSPEGQRAIGDFTINGQQLFRPNYRGGGS